MRTRAVLFVLVGMLTLPLFGCHHDEDATASTATPQTSDGSAPTMGAAKPMNKAKMESAPGPTLNEGYSGGVGSKAK